MYSTNKNLLLRLRKLISIFILITFVSTSLIPPQVSFAQVMPATVLDLPVPGTMIAPTPSVQPAQLKGLTILPDHPLQFDFIIQPGDQALSSEELKSTSTDLVKYFLAALTVPEEELWVNLSPHEADRIISDKFGATAMGRDLLAQDYILKQLTASLMYPESALGKKFWQRVHAKAQSMYGHTHVPTDVFNKVWIVPQKATVYEHGTTVYLVDAHLKVMLEEDYVEGIEEQRDKGIKERKDLYPSVPGSLSPLNHNQIIREVIIPAIEHEVNHGQHFVQLRQIYNALILATWYKKNLKQSLLGQVYVDQNKTQGVHVDDPQIHQKIYDQYLKAFEQGVYNYIKEEPDPVTGEMIPRKYFSGGAEMQVSEKLFTVTDYAQLTFTDQALIDQAMQANDDVVVTVDLQEAPSDAAMQMAMQRDAERYFEGESAEHYLRTRFREEGLEDVMGFLGFLKHGDGYRNDDRQEVQIQSVRLFPSQQPDGDTFEEYSIEFRIGDQITRDGFFLKTSHTPTEQGFTQRAFQINRAARTKIMMLPDGQEALIAQILTNPLSADPRQTLTFLQEQAQAIGLSLGLLHKEGIVHKRLIYRKDGQEKLLMSHIFVPRENGKLVVKFVDYGRAENIERGDERIQEHDDVIKHYLQTVVQKSENLDFTPQVEADLQAAFIAGYQEGFTDQAMQANDRVIVTVDLQEAPSDAAMSSQGVPDDRVIHLIQRAMWITNVLNEMEGHSESQIFANLLREENSTNGIERLSAKLDIPYYRVQSFALVSWVLSRSGLVEAMIKAYENRKITTDISFILDAMKNYIDRRMSLSEILEDIEDLFLDKSIYPWKKIVEFNAMDLIRQLESTYQDGIQKGIYRIETPPDAHIMIPEEVAESLEKFNGGIFVGDREYFALLHPGKALVHSLVNIYGFRHAKTLGNENPPFFQGSYLDHPVNQFDIFDPEIRQHVREGTIEMLDMFKKDGVDIQDVIFLASPLQRSIDTAELVKEFVKELAGFELIYEIDPMAKEISMGLWENHRVLNFSSDSELYRQMQNYWHDPRVRPPEGQSAIDFLVMRKHWVEDLNRRYPGKNIMNLGAHGAGMSMMRILQGDTLDMDAQTGSFRWIAGVPPNATPMLLIEKTKDPAMLELTAAQLAWTISFAGFAGTEALAALLHRTNRGNAILYRWLLDQQFKALTSERFLRTINQRQQTNLLLRNLIQADMRSIREQLIQRNVHVLSRYDAMRRMYFLGSTEDIQFALQELDRWSDEISHDRAGYSLESQLDQAWYYLQTKDPYGKNVDQAMSDTSSSPEASPQILSFQDISDEQWPSIVQQIQEILTKEEYMQPFENEDDLETFRNRKNRKISSVLMLDGKVKGFLLATALSRTIYAQKFFISNDRKLGLSGISFIRGAAQSFVDINNVEYVEAQSVHKDNKRAITFYQWLGMKPVNQGKSLLYFRVPIEQIKNKVLHRQDRQAQREARERKDSDDAAMSGVEDQERFRRMMGEDAEAVAEFLGINIADIRDMKEVSSTSLTRQIVTLTFMDGQRFIFEKIEVRSQEQIQARQMLYEEGLSPPVYERFENRLLVLKPWTTIALEDVHLGFGTGKRNRELTVQAVAYTLGVLHRRGFTHNWLFQQNSFQEPIHVEDGFPRSNIELHYRESTQRTKLRERRLRFAIFKNFQQVRAIPPGNSSHAPRERSLTQHNLFRFLDIVGEEKYKTLFQIYYQGGFAGKKMEEIQDDSDSAMTEEAYAATFGLGIHRYTTIPLSVTLMRLFQRSTGIKNSPIIFIGNNQYDLGKDSLFQEVQKIVAYLQKLWGQENQLALIEVQYIEEGQQIFLSLQGYEEENGVGVFERSVDAPRRSVNMGISTPERINLSLDFPIFLKALVAQFEDEVESITRNKSIDWEELPQRLESIFRAFLKQSFPNSEDDDIGRNLFRRSRKGQGILFLGKPLMEYQSGKYQWFPIDSADEDVRDIFSPFFTLEEMNKKVKSGQSRLDRAQEQLIKALEKDRILKELYGTHPLYQSLTTQKVERGDQDREEGLYYVSRDFLLILLLRTQHFPREKELDIAIHEETLGYSSFQTLNIFQILVEQLRLFQWGRSSVRGDRKIIHVPDALLRVATENPAGLRQVFDQVFGDRLNIIPKYFEKDFWNEYFSLREEFFHQVNQLDAEMSNDGQSVRDEEKPGKDIFFQMLNDVTQAHPVLLDVKTSQHSLRDLWISHLFNYAREYFQEDAQGWQDFLYWYDRLLEKRIDIIDGYQTQGSTDIMTLVQDVLITQNREGQSDSAMMDVAEPRFSYVGSAYEVWWDGTAYGHEISRQKTEYGDVLKIAASHFLGGHHFTFDPKEDMTRYRRGTEVGNNLETFEVSGNQIAGMGYSIELNLAQTPILHVFLTDRFPDEVFGEDTSKEGASQDVIRRRIRVRREAELSQAINEGMHVIDFDAAMGAAETAGIPGILPAAVAVQRGILQKHVQSAVAFARSRHQSFIRVQFDVDETEIPIILQPSQDPSEAQAYLQKIADQIIQWAVAKNTLINDMVSATQQEDMITVEVADTADAAMADEVKKSRNRKSTKVVFKTESILEGDRYQIRKFIQDTEFIHLSVERLFQKEISQEDIEQVNIQVLSLKGTKRMVYRVSVILKDQETFSFALKISREVSEDMLRRTVASILMTRYLERDVTFFGQLEDGRLVTSGSLFEGPTLDALRYDERFDLYNQKAVARSVYLWKQWGKRFILDPHPGQFIIMDFDTEYPYARLVDREDFLFTPLFQNAQLYIEKNALGEFVFSSNDIDLTNTRELIQQMGEVRFVEKLMIRLSEPVLNHEQGVDPDTEMMEMAQARQYPELKSSVLVEGIIEGLGYDGAVEFFKMFENNSERIYINGYRSLRVYLLEVLPEVFDESDAALLAQENSLNFSEVGEPSTQNNVLDRAMTDSIDSLSPSATPDNNTVGGIDLNPSSMELNIRRDGNGIPLPVHQQPIENLNIQGFVPIIINIRPLTNLPLLLGLNDIIDPPNDFSIERPLDPADRKARFDPEVFADVGA